MPRVLVVDDSAAVRSMLTSLLTEHGWQVEAVGDAESAIDRAGAIAPDAVVADLWMPGLSGLQMCRLLRDDAATARVPIVLLTAAGDRRARFWAAESGADFYLEKRLVADLPARLATLVRERRAAAPSPPAAPRSPCATTAARSVPARLSHLLDATLFDAVVAGRLRRLALEHDAPGGLFEALAELLASVLSYRWLALRIDTPGQTPELYVQHGPGDLGGLRAAASALELALDREPAGIVVATECMPDRGSAGRTVVRELTHRGTVLGRLAVGFSDARLVAEDQRVVETAAREAALALRMIGALGALQRLALTDALTGLLNRRAASDALDRAIAGAGRESRALSVIIADVDRFKSINDTHGHLAGDATLRHVSALLARCARRSDVVARWGGEEFLLVLPATSLEPARVVADRLRAAVAISPTLAPGGGRVAVTASFGVATWRGGAESRDELMGRADRALYAAKESGRNRVVCDLGPAITHASARFAAVTAPSESTATR